MLIWKKECFLSGSSILISQYLQKIHYNTCYNSIIHYICTFHIYYISLCYILKDNYSHFLSLGHPQNVVLVGENGRALMQRSIFRMVDNTLKMDKQFLIIVVAFCRRLICVKSFYVFIPVNKILITFLHCI